MIQSGEEKEIARVFQDSQSETKWRFIERLRVYLSDPQRYIAKVITDVSRNPIGIFVYRIDNPLELEIPLLRVAPGQLSNTLTRHIILQSLQYSSKQGAIFTKITDPCTNQVVINALSDFSFQNNNDYWIKANLAYSDTAAEISHLLKNLSTQHSEHSNLFVSLSNLAEHEIVKTEISFEIEHHFWPLKIVDAIIPTFIIPISPYWAQHLFDIDLANQTLFGANSELALRRENVYYRSICFPGGIRAPGRILWYVSHNNSYIGTKQIRACSRLDEVVIGKTKELYSRFRRLGVYEWGDIIRTARNSIDNEIMALLFSDTELFEHPISLYKVKGLLESKGYNTSLRSPTLIAPDIFADLYRSGTKGDALKYDR